MSDDNSRIRKTLVRLIRACKYSDEKDKPKRKDLTESLNAEIEKDYGDRIKLAESIVDSLDKKNIAVRISCNSYKEKDVVKGFIVVSRFEKIYEDFTLAVLNLNTGDKESLKPCVRDGRSGFKYKIQKPRKGPEDFVDLFLWTMGEKPDCDCKDIIERCGLQDKNRVPITDRTSAVKK